jgi:hypothetical protein
MPKPISPAEASAPRIVIVTMDGDVPDRMTSLDRMAATKNANRVLEAQERRCASRCTDTLRRAGDGFGDHIDDNVEGAAA